MSDKSLLKQVLVDSYGIEFRGWDFRHLDGWKHDRNELAWNYQGTIVKLIETAESLLDMGTGGGEFLDSLPKLPPRVSATEGYPPNVEVAANRLGRKGVRVVPMEDDSNLGFEDESFDLVINRHESFSAKELTRILKKGARFVTQQVGGMNDRNLNATLGSPEPEHSGWCLAQAVAELKGQGLNILEMKESLGCTRFTDIRGIVYYLKCIPWQIQDFTVDRYFERLVFLDDLIRQQGYFDSLNHRFFILAEK